jgi:hypothetical protein
MLSILQRPQKFSPSGNKMIWQVESDDSTIVYFKSELIDTDTTTTISQFNIFPTPQTPTGSFIDLSRLVSNVVNWEINNNQSLFVAPMHKTVRGYRLKITERIPDTTTGLIVDGDEYNNINDVSYAFNAQLGRITAANWQQLKYVINPTSLASFLTNKPNFVKTNDISAECLYFLQDEQASFLQARVRTFNKNGSQIFSSIQGFSLTDYKMFRLNVSPKSLMQSCNLDFTNVHKYVIDILDGGNVPVTEERVYYYEPLDCNLDYVNLLFVNALGGIDSYQWVAPVDTINVSRFVMKTNSSSINSDGILSDVSDGVFNPSDVIIENKTTTVTRVTSTPLNDAEAYWLQELFESKQIFIELTDGSITPALLNNTTYQIPRLKYSRGQLNIIQIDFTLADGIIPTGSHAFSTKKASIEFINSQMNTIQNNLPGYDITVGTSGNDYDTNDYEHITPSYG